MSQDTRKDKRAKIVSLNVRYKSATVDEFIENHSHDVSRGGVFVKTPTPFAPGTLLKFEIRLAGDKSVIAGVGRVVWKREPTNAAPDRPAGMGVKFIKVDDSSRQVIDKLIDSKSDAGSAFLSEPEQPDTASAPPPQLVPGASGGPSAAARSMGKMTMIGTPPPAMLPGVNPTGPTVPGNTSSPSTPAAKPFSKKGTMIGVGLPSGEIEAPRDPLGSAPQFPKDELDPTREPTVVKQASELLNEALKEAGGTVDDLGDALFANLERKDPPAEAKKSEPPKAAEKKEEEKKDEEKKKSEPPAEAKKSEPPKAEKKDEAKKKSEPPAAAKKSEPPKPVAAQPANDEKSSNTMVIAIAVIVLAIGGFALFKYFNADDAKTPESGAPSASSKPAPVPTPIATPAPVPTPMVVAPTATPTASATTAPSASATAGTKASASAMPAPVPVPVVPAPPPRNPGVVVPPAPHAPPTAKATATAKVTAEAPAPPPPPPPSPTGDMGIK